jgi:hypothetical protein
MSLVTRRACQSAVDFTLFAGRDIFFAQRIAPQLTPRGYSSRNKKPRGVSGGAKSLFFLSKEVTAN